MLTIHYDLGGVCATVTSSVEDIHATLRELYPLMPARPVDATSACFDITANQTGFSLTGSGSCYQTTDFDTLIPALESCIRDLFVDQVRRSWVLHSSGFLTDRGDAVLAVGHPGAGKTTLALRALAAGAGGLSDELHLWYPHDGSVVGYPRAYAVKEGTFRAFPGFRHMIAQSVPARWNNQRLWYVDPGRFGRRGGMNPVKLRALVFLSREGDQRSLRLVPHWQRLTALLHHAWIPDSLPLEQCLDSVLGALGSVDVWEGGPEIVLQTFLGHQAIEPS